MKLLIAAMLFQMGWTLVVLVMTGRARVAALKAREVTLKQVALSNDAWPDRIKALSNNYANQFETPVLFYAACLLALHLGATGWEMCALAWLFVATRIAHTLVHTGGNNVILRFRIFVAGVGVLVAMLVGIAFVALA